MQEMILENKKHGMRTLFICILVELMAIAGIIFAAVLSESGAKNGLWVSLLIISALLAFTAWIPLVGLKVLKPQEALALTLFGKYIGTLKGEGFYSVNPFCVAVNPAAQTKLNQSGDVSQQKIRPAENELNISFSIPNKKLSLKVMTLNNNRQKIND